MKRILRLTIVIIGALFVSVTIGGNGCLWLGQENNSGSSVPAASTGLYQPTVPFPPDRASGFPPNIQLSWSSVLDATTYDVYFGTAWPPPFQANIPNTIYRTRYNVPFEDEHFTSRTES